MIPEELQHLVDHLRSLPDETEWVEFKHNNPNPQDICEERGSGIDKVVAAVEEFQSPPPDFRTTPQHTVAVLFAPRAFADMDRQERIRACYQHACLWYVTGKEMKNSTLRARLGIEKHNHATASRIIRDTITAGLIRQAGGSTRDARYVPFWA